MPTLRSGMEYKFRFCSSDGAEPPHGHIVKGELSAKVWLMSMEIANNHGYNNREVAEFLARIDESRADWMEKWNEFFGI
ncbi:hypothetical protein A6R70_09875 [Agrobacterium rubi]|nr:hypothetical protein [Agrobacterium rubi]